MKHTIQFRATFGDDDANQILNKIEDLKTDVFIPIECTPVEIVQKGEKRAPSPDGIKKGKLHKGIDFNTGKMLDTTKHGTKNVVEVDVSFSDETKADDLINLLEAVKSLADPKEERFGRRFISNHDEKPLKRDGEYTYIDFDGKQLTYPIVEPTQLQAQTQGQGKGKAKGL